MSAGDPCGAAALNCPDFVDNQGGNTLAAAINAHLGARRAGGKAPHELCIATAYFNPQGLWLVESELEHVPRVRLLLGADPTPERTIALRRPGDPREPQFTLRRVKAAIDEALKALKRDRDRQPFTLQNQVAIQRLLHFLRSGKIDVRRYTRHFLHAKAFLFRAADGGLLSGSSNLTAAGLASNLELNLGHYETPVVGRVERWYEELWEKAEPFDLAAIYAEELLPVPPYLVYLRILWQLYGDELLEEPVEQRHVPTTSFQAHGVLRAKRILKDYGGVLIADEVGLGKTFIAGAILEDYLARRQRALLVCPASLRDTTWAKFIARYQLYCEVVSYEELANHVQLHGKTRHIQRPLDEYQLVIVDEAHNYRNPNTPTRAAILRDVLAGRRRDVVMLTATPVNNSLWDLYHLLRFYLKQDALLAHRGVLSIRDRFMHATRVDPFSLSPDVLYPVIDATTVKRTRQFVRKHYSGERITRADGSQVPIVFPKPHALSVKYELDAVLPGFFDRFEDALMPPHGHPQLTLARYAPECFPAGSQPRDIDTALVGLIRSGLLKRFESSCHAFAKTTAKMADQHVTFLKALDQGRVIQSGFFREVAGAEELEDDELDEALSSSSDVAGTSAYNVAALRKAVEADERLLRRLSEEASSVARNRDPKLAALVEELARVADQATREATGRDDEIQKRKVLVFSYFEDTLDWIEEHLRSVIDAEPRLAAYRGRMASVSGRPSRNGISHADAVDGFAPISMEASLPDDRYDLLLSTDVLAEGVNLQQCRNIINYDLPWNPMRLVQRHGRIDRIASEHSEVFLRTFFPDDELERLLRIEQRVRIKLARAAASIGLGSAPIAGATTSERSFAETVEEIERLRREDATLFERGGTAGAAQTGEEYRHELRKALEDAALRSRIEEFPWKAGSGMRKGSERGFVFCAVVGDGTAAAVRQRAGRTYLRFVSADQSKAVTPDVPIEVSRELGACLRRIECTRDTERFVSDEAREGVFAAWERARDDIFEAWTFETEPRNLQPDVPKLNRDVAQWLRDHPPTEIDGSVDDVISAVAAPWSEREKRRLGEVWKATERDSPVDRSRKLVAAVREIGAEPFHPPEPLDPIEKDEIHLVAWMALEPEGV
jgi:hypothetical protein